MTDTDYMHEGRRQDAGATNPIPHFLLLVLLGAAALAAACQGNPRAERIKAKEAVINLGNSPGTLDPSLATDNYSQNAIACFTRGLTRLDEKNEVHPELAESWTVSPDGRTWDFKLRPAKWSNGEPVTADDFVYTWTRRMLNPKFGAELVYDLYRIKGARAFFENQALGADSVGVKAVAPDLLRVTLVNPLPIFPKLVYNFNFYPVCRKTAEANPDWALRAETYVGCGPFVMDSYVPGKQITGRKNPNYWNAAQVGLERITLTCIQTEATERGAFDAGEVDGTWSVPRTDIDALRSAPELRSSPQCCTQMLNLNCRAPALKDPRVRRALALAVDRAAITRTVTRAGDRPALSLTPPDLYRKPPEPLFKDAQYDEARRLLAEAGYPGGKGFPTLHYLCNEREIYKQTALVIQEGWRRELGIQTELELLEFKVMIDRTRAGTYEVARIGQVFLSSPLFFLELFDSKNEANDCKFNDPKYDAMLAAAQAEPDPARNEDLLRQAETYLMTQTPFVPVYYENQPFLCAPALQGYWLDPWAFFNAAQMKWK